MLKKINSIILASELGKVTEYTEIDDDIRYDFLPFDFYRGSDTLIKLKDGFVLSTTGKVRRGTLHHFNIFNYFIDNVISEWKGFPKRNCSIFCTNSHEIADSYGKGIQQLKIINGSKVAYTEFNDFWTSLIIALRDIVDTTNFPSISLFNRNILQNIIYCNSSTKEEADSFNLNNSTAVDDVLNLIHRADEIIFDNDYSIPVDTFKRETYKKILNSSLGPSKDSDRLMSIVSLYEKKLNFYNFLMLFTPDKLQSYILTEHTKLNPKKGYEIWFEGSAVVKQYVKS